MAAERNKSIKDKYSLWNEFNDNSFHHFLSQIKLNSDKDIRLFLCLMTFTLMTCSTQGIKTYCVAPSTQEGSSATITCHFDADISQLQRNVYVHHTKSDGSFAEVLITCQWSKQRQQCAVNAGFEITGTITNQLNFTITTVHSEHAGEYWCDVFKSTELSTCSLIITDRSFTLEVISHETAVEGTSLGLVCKTRPNMENLIVEWLNIKSIQALATFGVEQKENLLILNNIHRNYSGLEIACRVSKDGAIWSRNSETYIVHPEYAPTEQDILFVPIRNDVTVQLGSSLLQICNASCRPICKLGWEKFFRGSKVNLTENGILYMNYTERNHHGTYSCFAYNRHGKASRQFSIYIESIPQAVIGDGQLKEIYTSDVNEDFIVEFQIEGYPKPDITRIMFADRNNTAQILPAKMYLIKSLEETTTKPLVTTFTLLMENVSSTFLGCIYYIEITNSVGRTRLQFWLLRKGVASYISSF